MNTGINTWHQGKSGTWYFANGANGRVIGFVEPLPDDDMYKVTDIRQAEVIYKGLANAKKAIEAVTELVQAKQAAKQQRPARPA